MPSLNLVCIIGNVGSDCEMRFTPSGKPTTSFRVAVNRNYTDAEGNRKEQTEWWSIVTWGKLAESCNQYLDKGSLVFVEGRLQTRMWEKDGVKHYRTEIIANKVIFLSKPKNGVGENSTTAENQGEENEEVPFQ